uniref:hypothetical protein n=1 Tax=Neorhizobium sp. EC2-8 TaxID=3129230 RepID=UPI0031013045
MRRGYSCAFLIGQGAGAITNLTIQPDSFTVATSDLNPGAVRVTGAAGDGADADAVRARYDFDLARKPGQRDRLKIAVGEDLSKPVSLALPLIETAERIREACKLPRPAPTDELGLLWTFTPIPDGWMHWPLPNADAAALGRLLDDASGASPAGEIAAVDGSGVSITGSLAYGNLPGRANFTRRHRSWSLAVSDVKGAQFDFHLVHMAGGSETVGSIVRATVKLEDVSLTFDGVFHVTAFKQTEQRLLPEHAERALGTFALRGVSPSGLRGIEARMWKQSMHPTAAARIRLEALVGVADRDGSRWPCCHRPWDRGRTRHRNGWNLNARRIMARGDAAMGMVRRRTASSRPNIADRRSGAGQKRAFLYALSCTSQAEESAGADGKLRYVVENLDTTQPWLDVVIRYAGLVEGSQQPKFVKPAAPGAWRDEVTMAVTTLPSVSFVVGSEARPGASKLAENWNGLQTSVAAEFRHDIALRDEHNAFQSAPTPPFKKEAPQFDFVPERPAVDALFSPLPNNGPDNGPRNPLQTNGWAVIRLAMNRKAALAALDDRSMTSSVKNAIYLSGMFGDAAYKLEGQIEVTPATIISGDAGAANRRVVAIGGLRMDFAAPIDPDGQTSTLDFQGLPAESDLVGVSARFQRLAGWSDVRFGTAFAKAANGGFVDQHGLSLIETMTGSAVAIRKMRAPVGDGAVFELGDEVRLVTLVKPIKIVGAQLTFWCADVPVIAGSADATLARFTSQGAIEDRGNAFQRPLNHLAGFRWMLGGADMAGGCVLLGGLAFEPMELTGFKQVGQDLPTSIDIRGRLRVPVREDGLSPPLDGGLATLTLTVADATQGTFSAKLTASDVVMPLADPDTFDGMAPTIGIKSLPNRESRSKPSCASVSRARISIVRSRSLARPTERSRLRSSEPRFPRLRAQRLGSSSWKRTVRSAGRCRWQTGLGCRFRTVPRSSLAWCSENPARSLSANAASISCAASAAAARDRASSPGGSRRPRRFRTSSSTRSRFRQASSPCAGWRKNRQEAYSVDRHSRPRTAAPSPCSLAGNWHKATFHLSTSPRAVSGRISA